MQNCHHKDFYALTSLLHEAEQLVQELLPLRIVVDLVKLKRIFFSSLEKRCRLATSMVRGPILQAVQAAVH
jgi:hypothetical protein